MIDTDPLEIAECSDPQSGFMQKLCQFSVPQDTIPANSSLIATSDITGAVLVGTSYEGEHKVLVLRAFGDLLPASSENATSAANSLQDCDHCEIHLASPCFWVSWSPDGALAGVAGVDGDVLVFSAQDLLERRITQPVRQLHHSGIRQIEWGRGSSILYIIDQSRKLCLHNLASGRAGGAIELHADITAIAARESFVVYGQGIADTPNLVVCKCDEQMSTLVTHSVSVPDSWPCIIDSIAFISPTTLVIELIAVDESSPDYNGVSPSEEVFFSVVVLDDASHPTSVTHDMLAPERFHNGFQAIGSEKEGGVPKGSRSRMDGPFMTAGAFPGSFPAAVACSSLLSELHFLHLFYAPVEEDENELQWQAVVNAIDAMQLNLPAAEQSGVQIPNYVIGTAPFCNKKGVTVHHKLDGIDPAENVPQMLFLMSGGQLVVANIGTFRPAQMHSSVIKDPVGAPALPFSADPECDDEEEKSSEDTEYKPSEEEEDDDSETDLASESALTETSSTRAQRLDPAVLTAATPEDPTVYQDTDTGDQTAVQLQATHVQPSEELDDGDSLFNDENREDAENATPAQHRVSSGSQLQPLEPATVPHAGRNSGRLREPSQPGSTSSQSPLQPMALPPPTLSHPGAPQEPFALASARTTGPENAHDTLEALEHSPVFVASPQSSEVPRISPSLSPAAGADASAEPAVMTGTGTVTMSGSIPALAPVTAPPSLAPEPSEPSQPAICMSQAPALNHELPVRKQKSSMVAQFKKELKELPAAPGPVASSATADSQKMFESELESIHHLLSEVRVAVKLSADSMPDTSDHEHVRSRGDEMRVVGEWCYQEGGTLISHLTLHAKSCLRKLDAVQDMLKVQEDQHGSDADSMDSLAGYGCNDSELPLRDVERPQRIIEVVYSKVLELESTINSQLLDLNATGDALAATQQSKFGHMKAAQASHEDPFIAVAELQESMKLLQQRLLQQRSVLQRALWLPTEPSLKPSQLPSGRYKMSPPVGTNASIMTPSIRAAGSSTLLAVSQQVISGQAQQSQTQLYTPSQQPYASSWRLQGAADEDIFSPAFVSAQRGSATRATRVLGSPGVFMRDVGRKAPCNPSYDRHANRIRDLISRSSYKKTVETSEESPQISNLSSIMERAAYQAQARCVQTVQPKLSTKPAAESAASKHLPAASKATTASTAVCLAPAALSMPPTTSGLPSMDRVRDKPAPATPVLPALASSSTTAQQSLAATVDSAAAALFASPKALVAAPRTVRYPAVTSSSLTATSLVRAHDGADKPAPSTSALPLFESGASLALEPEAAKIESPAAGLVATLQPPDPTSTGDSASESSDILSALQKSSALTVASTAPPVPLKSPESAHSSLFSVPARHNVEGTSAVPLFPTASTPASTSAGKSVTPEQGVGTLTSSLGSLFRMGTSSSAPFGAATAAPAVLEVPSTASPLSSTSAASSAAVISAPSFPVTTATPATGATAAPTAATSVVTGGLCAAPAATTKTPTESAASSASVSSPEIAQKTVISSPATSSPAEAITSSTSTAAQTAASSSFLQSAGAFSTLSLSLASSSSPFQPAASSTSMFQPVAPVTAASPPPATSLFPALGSAAATSSTAPFSSTLASVPSIFGGGASSAAPAFGQPAQLGNSLFGAAPMSGSGSIFGAVSAASSSSDFGQLSQAQPAFRSGFGATQAPQTSLATPASSAASAFGSSFTSSATGGFAGLSQGSASTPFGGAAGGLTTSAPPQPTSLFPALGTSPAPASTSPFASALSTAPSIFGGSAAPSFGQPAHLGSGIPGVTAASSSSGFGMMSTPSTGSLFGAAPNSGSMFGQAAQPQSAFGAAFGAPQAPQANLSNPAASNTGPTFGASFTTSAGGGFAALSQNASSATFGGGAFAAPAAGNTFGSGFSFGGGSPFSGGAFGGSSSPFPASLSASGTSPSVNAGMLAPRR